MTGTWNINVSFNMPQKIATAFDMANEILLGADYRFIAYIGSQVVNGTNHAVLAEQTVLSGRDSKHVVVMVFNEKPNEMGATLVAVERIVESGMPMGGTVVDATADIPEDKMNIWKEAFTGYVGANAEPFAYLGSQVVNGTNYIFAATLRAITPKTTDEAVIVTINSTTHRVSMIDPLEPVQTRSLGYAFTW